MTMAGAIDLTGKRFGKLVGLRRAPNKEYKQTRWLFRCDCGKEKEMNGQHVRSGLSRSCGCSRGEKMVAGWKAECRRRRGTKTPKEYAAFRFWGYKESISRRREFEFTLTEEEVYDLMYSDCLYCGASPTNTMEAKEEGSYIRGIRYNGIDRIDSAIGYTTENSVPCCKTCNRYKSARSVEDFVGWCATVASRKRLIEGTLLWRKNAARKAIESDRLLVQSS